MTPSPPTLQTFELAADALVGQHFWRRSPTRLTIDSIGIRIDYGLSRSRVLRWESRRLQFALLDFRDSRRNHPPWVRHPKQFELRYRPELGLSAFAIPEEAFRKLNTAAEASGLIPGPSVTGGGIPACTKVLHYARKPPRWRS